ncbi:MAG: transposase [Methylocella sp.]
MAGQSRPNPTASFFGDAEFDLFANMAFPAAHRTKLHSTNSLERLNGNSKRGIEVALIFPPPAIPSRLARRNLGRLRPAPSGRRHPAGAERRSASTGTLGATPV